MAETMTVRDMAAYLIENPIPDLWHIAVNFREMGYSGEADYILKAWHIAHDLANVVRAAAAVDNN
jgi:hypothetical protein